MSQNILTTLNSVFHTNFLQCSLVKWITLVSDYSVCKSQRSIRKSRDYVFVFYGHVLLCTCILCWCILTHYSRYWILCSSTFISISFKPLIRIRYYVSDNAGHRECMCKWSMKRMNHSIRTSFKDIGIDFTRTKEEEEKKTTYSRSKSIAFTNWVLEFLLFT